MIKAILFDFDQTLVDSAQGFRKAEKNVQKEIFGDLALASWEKFLANYRKIRKKFHSQYNFSRKACWQEVYWYYCREHNSRLLENWELDYWQTVSDKTILFPETIPVLEKLASAYSLGLITNTQGQPSNKHRITMFARLKKFFDVVIISGQAGIPPKPDPQAFYAALEKLSVKPHQALYVGDNWHIDICGAENAGLRTVWLKHHRVPRNFPDVQTTTPVINSLDELLKISN